MKKILSIFIAVSFLFLQTEAQAKAVKLGRGKASAVYSTNNLNNGSNAELKKGECDTDQECPDGKKCSQYKCVDVCSLQPCKAGQKCITNPSSPHSAKCVDACYNISCKPGYTTEASTNGCCCVSLCSDNCATCSSAGTCTQCNSGFYLSGSQCVACPANATCDGTIFSCKSGYKKSGSSCVLDTCDAGYYKNGNFCISCPEGCTACSQLVPGVVTCSTCKSGYYKSGTRCASCPDNAASCSGSSFTCKTGFYKDGSACATCPENCTACSDATTCTSCASGYTLKEGACVKSSTGDGPRTITLPGLGTDGGIPASNCAANLQDCGGGTCCPKGNTCSYYRNLGYYMCITKNSNSHIDMNPAF